MNKGKLPKKDPSSIRNTIAVLNNRKKELEEEYRLKIKEIDNVISGLRGDNTIESTNKKTSEKKHLQIPSNYDSNLSWDEKTLFVLSKLNEGFVTDLADKLCSIDDSFTKEQASRNITLSASRLYDKGNGVIDAKKFGKKYKYFLK